MNDSEKSYNEWIGLIAESSDQSELVSHFRDHVGDHFRHHDDEGEFGFKIWLIGVINFMKIFEIKFSELAKEEMLFQLCRYYKEKGKGPKPPFDIDGFMERFDNNKIKNYYEKRYQKNISEPELP